MADKKSSGSMFDMFQKFGENLSLPKPDIENVVSYHRKNIQALQDAVSATTTGAQGMMSKQREQLEEGLAEITEMVQGINATSSPKQVVTDQVAFAKKSFEKTIKNATELGEIAKDTGSESFNILKDRMQEGVQEIRDSIGKKEG
ncbi:MAG: TIGR01841 family phasin [Rhizobiaceae bacterium]